MGNTFLINTITAWDEPPRARHQLAFALANNHKVYFVTRNNTGRPQIKMYSPQKNITVIEPTFPIDYRYRYRLPVINEIYQRWLFRRIRRKINYQVCVNFDFTARLVFRYFSNCMYYCNDDYIGNSKYPLGIINKYHVKCENTVIRKSAFCIATAQFIEDKLKEINPHTYLIPLGSPGISDINVVPDSYKKKEIIHANLMYVNTRHLSHILINEVIQRGDIKLTCIGPQDPEFEGKIIKNGNVEFKGVLKGDKLYEEINKADVGIAPYEVDKVNKGGTPNKLWQYFALGKPVIISNLPNLKYMKFPDKFIYIYDTADQFYDLIKKSHHENSDLLIHSRIQFAHFNSWDKRSEEFLIIAKNYFDFDEPIQLIQRNTLSPDIQVVTGNI